MITYMLQTIRVWEASNVVAQGSKEFVRHGTDMSKVEVEDCRQLLSLFVIENVVDGCRAQVSYIVEKRPIISRYIQSQRVRGPSLASACPSEDQGAHV